MKKRNYSLEYKIIRMSVVKRTVRRFVDEHLGGDIGIQEKFFDILLEERRRHIDKKI